MVAERHRPGWFAPATQIANRHRRSARRAPRDRNATLRWRRRAAMIEPARRERPRCWVKPIAVFRPGGVKLGHREAAMSVGSDGPFST